MCLASLSNITENQGRDTRKGQHNHCWNPTAINVTFQTSRYCLVVVKASWQLKIVKGFGKSKEHCPKYPENAPHNRLVWLRYIDDILNLDSRTRQTHRISTLNNILPNINFTSYINFTLPYQRTHFLDVIVVLNEGNTHSTDLYV